MFCTGKRVLVVDDDPLLASLIRDFLELGGHEVEISDDTPAAIRKLASNGYDVLITDLNIKGPADGYILAGAARKLRPDALILLLTGLPDLESAWKSIQDSVDRLLLKPVDPFALDQLAKSIDVAGTPVPTPLNLAQLIAAHEDELVNDWFEHVEADPAVATIPLSRKDRLDDLRPIIAIIIDHIEHPDVPITPDRAQAARNHGILRRANGYPVVALLREGSHLRQSITRLITSHFIELDPRNALAEMFEMNVIIDENMALSLTAYLGE